MKLASLKDGRDGRLVVVSDDLAYYADAGHIVASLQAALDDWDRFEPALRLLATDLQHGAIPLERFHERDVASPLPRAYQWADGSAYVNHVALVRQARGAEMPDSFWHDPLMYQGGSDAFLGPRDDIPLADENWGCDLEAEVVVVTGDVPQGISREDAIGLVRLVGLTNDVSLRNLIPGELAKGFGFYQSKPATAFAPVAVTPDELGDAWHDSKLHLPLSSRINGRVFGQPEAGIDMTFSFAQLIAHVTRTRKLGAGAIVGSGTVSNYDRSRGSSCLAEVRMLEQIDHGQADTAFLKFGDRVEIEMHARDGTNIFGTLDNRVVPLAR